MAVSLRSVAIPLVMVVLAAGCAGGGTQVSDGEGDGGASDASARTDSALTDGTAPTDGPTAPTDAPTPFDTASPDADASADGASSMDASMTDGMTLEAATGDGACSTGMTGPCTTACGSTGTETCASGAWGSCAPPPEICNLMDDDCNGQCDDILGCRIGVDRSFSGTSGQHFYTTTDSEASCCGYSVETYDYYYLYATAQAGLVPFYRCSTAAGDHLYTTDASCEGETVEGSMGWIATTSVCGSVPLYRLFNATSGDHLYTTSMAEVTSAEGGGYVSQGTAGYVWPAICGGTSCTWPSPIAMVGSTTTAATGFPTTWYGFPVEAGTQSFSALSGSVSVTNSANIYSEVLFILQTLPTGACATGRWPASTPEYGPPGARGIGQFIVKAPTTGTFTVPLGFTLPGGLPISNCVLLGLNGGTVSTSHDVTASANLTLTFTGPELPAQSILGPGGEFCFGQSFGCQGSTTNDALSFATVTPIAQSVQLVALYGDISDSTFDGTSSFGAPPAGAWTGTNDFYVYHGTECAAFGVASGVAGPGDYYASIPADATHLLSVPLSGTGIGVSEAPVFKTFTNVPLPAGDCLVTLWGVQGGGAFDNETQVDALVAP